MTLTTNEKTPPRSPPKVVARLHQANEVPLFSEENISANRLIEIGLAAPIPIAAVILKILNIIILIEKAVKISETAQIPPAIIKSHFRLNISEK